VVDRTHDTRDSKIAHFGNSRLDLFQASLFVKASPDEKSADKLPDEPRHEKDMTPAGARQEGQVSGQQSDSRAKTAANQSQAQAQTQGQTSGQPTQQADHRNFWERLFNMPPVSKRLERALTEEWALEYRPHNIEWLLSDEGEDARIFFLDTSNAREYHRLVKEFGCGLEDRNGKIVDDSFDTLSEYGPELVRNYHILIENHDVIKRYYAGLFRDGRIASPSLIRISNSVWFGPFEARRFKLAAYYLHNRFQVPDHIVGPMLSSVGDSLGLRQIMSRQAAPTEFRQLLARISSPSSPESGNAFAPALQLMVLGEEQKVPFTSLDSFVTRLQLKPQDFGPFSAIVYNLGPYKLANEIKCPTFAQYLRVVLDEFGPSLNQESARLFVLSYREYKENNEALQALLSPQYRETKAFLKGIGIPIPATIWSMDRIALLTTMLTPDKRDKITHLVRELSEEVKVADIMFLSDICDNDEERKLLLNRPALVSAVSDIKIDRIVERSHNDLVKELEREIENANRNGLYRTVRRLSNLLKDEKQAYTERVDPNKLSNLQLSRLLIFHRSLEMPGILNTLGWNVSLDLQNERSEGGGYLGYDKDMAMVTVVAGIPMGNRQYRALTLARASASLALFHNHAFKDTFADKYLGFMGWLLPSNKNKANYAGPSGWVGAKKGDITAAAESELPSFIITKIGNPKNADGSTDRKSLLVNLDWVVVDPQTGEALRSDRGIFTVPYYGDEELGKLKWPSKKERQRQEREKRDKCPLGIKQETVSR
jgi:hypothetical protein